MKKNYRVVVSVKSSTGYYNNNIFIVKADNIRDAIEKSTYVINFTFSDDFDYEIIDIRELD